jgi:hypothetical protein
MQLPPSSPLRNLGRTVACLCLAAIFGVMSGTGTACAIGISAGTFTYCGFSLIWPVGFIIAVPFALVIGLPSDWLFRRYGWRRWWQFALAGVVIALPVWHQLTDSFNSLAWRDNGLFGTINLLGSGLAGGLIYWWLRIRPESLQAA